MDKDATAVVVETPAAAAAAAVTDVDNEPADAHAKRLASERALWWWNLGCGLLHLSQAAAVLGLGLSKTLRLAAFKLPLTTQFFSFQSGLPVSQVVTRSIMPFVAVTSGFAWMSAAAHLLVLLCFKTYIADLRRGINRFRWYEYAFSSSLMIWLIAMLFGMYDIVSLTLLAGVNACMNLFGYLQESTNLGRLARGERIDWTPFVFGCFAGALPWACLFTYLGGAGDANSVPGFVWAILFCYFVCFNSFPIGMIGAYARLGWFSDAYWKSFAGAGYYHSERSYQVQSLVSKSLLLWLVVGGANQPNQYTRNA